MKAAFFVVVSQATLGLTLALTVPEENLRETDGGAARMIFVTKADAGKEKDMNDLPKTLPGILRDMADMLDGPQNAGNLVVPAIIGRFREADNVIEHLKAENAELKRYRQIAEAQNEKIDELESRLVQRLELIAQQERELNWWDEIIKTQEANLACVTAERDAFRAQQEQPNEPLTLEELRAMDGEPVWCVDINKMVPGLVCMWEGLADCEKAPHVWLLDNEGIAKMYSIRHMMDCGAKFYRRKPEQEGAQNDH